uniref:phosphoglycolate phosphatase n=1 Tax=Prevotella sp. GTC17260 TaxID=3236796 RepID=A0AB33JEG8_9BACT
MAIKVVLLDFDGTLGDTQKLITDTMLDTIDVLGLEKRTREECAAMIGLPLKETFTGLIPMSDEMGDKCVETYTEIFTRRNVPHAVLPFPHVIETIRELHRREVKLTIASSRHRGSLLNFIHEFELDDYISAVVSAQDVEHCKPHPEMVEKTLAMFGVRPDEALMVGDARFDIQMGKAAGVHTCGVTYGNGSREDMMSVEAEHIIDDFADLLNVVESYDSYSL